MNIMGAIVFLYDKHLAKKKSHHRIPEKVLHLIELLGGVVGILIIMLGEGHKKSKKSYYRWTYVIFVLWVLGFFLVIARL
jgi:uncharacterized membrane protein YsdA (DUF1294 family)